MPALEFGIRWERVEQERVVMYLTTADKKISVFLLLTLSVLLSLTWQAHLVLCKKCKRAFAMALAMSSGVIVFPSLRRDPLR